MNTVWKKREKQILVVLDNLSGMRGEIEGIVGGQKALPGLEGQARHSQLAIKSFANCLDIFALRRN